MNRLKIVLSVGVALLLTGCLESRKNTTQLCEKNPQLHCELFNVSDGQCRVPRTTVIWHRYDGLPSPSDAHKIKEYELLSAYGKCLDLAAQIEPIDGSNIKEVRFAALMNTEKEKARIASELSNSQLPESLYFLWSQLGDESARREFLQMEGTSAVDTAELQYALATFYTSRDKPKTLRLLYRALELSESVELNQEITRSLAGIHQNLKDNESAYVWALTAREFGTSIASEDQLSRYYKFDKATKERLDQLAEGYIDAIKEYEFIAPE